MKNLRFWILLGGSVSVCALYLFQIYLSQKIFTEQRILMQGQQFASMEGTYEASWKQLATRLYQVSSKDPALAEVLKRNNIAIQPGKPGTTGAAPSIPTPPPMPAPVPVQPPTTSKTKTPVGP